MDLENLAAVNVEQGAVMQVVHPTKGAIDGMTMTLRSVDSPAMREALRKQLDLNARRIRSNQPISRDDTEAQALDVLAHAVVSWTGFVEKGQAMACTIDNVRHLLGDPRFAWLRKQVTQFVEAESNFFGE